MTDSGQTGIHRFQPVSYHKEAKMDEGQLTNEGGFAELAVDGLSQFVPQDISTGQVGSDERQSRQCLAQALKRFKCAVSPTAASHGEGLAHHVVCQDAAFR